MASCDQIAPGQSAPGMAQLRQLGCDAFVEIGPQPILVKRLGWPIWDPSFFYGCSIGKMVINQWMVAR